MRKGISSLCNVVHERMGCSVKNGDVFIFYVASFISLCQGTATSGSINHMYERLYVTESKLRVHLDSPLLKERKVFFKKVRKWANLKIGCGY